VSKPDHISQKAWDTALKLLEIAPDKWTKGPNGDSGTRTGGICAGTYIREDGTADGNADCGYAASGHLGGRVCHGFMQIGSYYKPSPVLFFNTMKSNFYLKQDHVAIREFCKWMKKLSPVRKFILNETVDSMFHGGIIIDCTNCPSNVLLWICKIFRCAYEDTWRIPLWYELSKRGVHPMLALVTSQCVTNKLLLQSHQTHNSCMHPPTKTTIGSLFVDHLPLNTENPFDCGYETSSVFGGYGYNSASLLPVNKTGRTKKVADGWGGYSTVSVPANVDTLAEDLKELQKEYV
jgi:hypothetical protein